MLIHELAEKHNLEHKSKGQAQERYLKNKYLRFSLFFV